MNKRTFFFLVINLCILINPFISIAQSSAWTWAKREGSGGEISDMTHDSAGNRYVTGFFTGSQFGLGTKTVYMHPSSSTNLSDMFLAKYGPNNTVLWLKSAGLSGRTKGVKVAVDQNGNVYVTGYFINFIIFGNDTLRTLFNTYDHWGMFLAKYDKDGNAIWGRASAQVSNSDVFPYGLSYDGLGNLFISGMIVGSKVSIGNDTLYPTGPANGGGFQGGAIFIAKFDTLGNALWAKSTKGNNYDCAFDLATDNSGNAIITGFYTSDSIGFGSHKLYSSYNAYTFFLTKYDPQGNILWVKSTANHSTQLELAKNVETDSLGNIYVTGSFGAYPTFDTITLPYAQGGVRDVFLVKYNPSGNAVWAKAIRGLRADNSGGLAVTPGGTVYISGDFSSNTLTFGPKILTNSNITNVNVSFDIFIAKYDTNGNVIWVNSAYSIYNEHTNGVDYAINGNPIVYGYFEFTTLFGSFTLPPGSVYNTIFLAQAQGCGLPSQSQPVSQSLAVGDTAVFTVSNSSTTAQFWWQKSVAGGWFNNVINGGIYSGSHNDTLTITNLGAAENNNSFRCIVIDFPCRDTSVAALLTVNSLGIKVKDKESKVLLYPNPAKGVIYIHLDFNTKPVHVEIYSLKGELIKKEAITLTNQELDVRSIARGVYLFRIQSDGKTLSAQKITLD